MTNNKDCPVCNAYANFTEAVKEGFPVQEAFELSVGYLLSKTIEHVTEDTIDVLHAEIYRSGFLSGLRASAKQAQEIADVLEFGNPEEPCGCEDCQLEQEHSKCDGCDCADGECEVDTAKLIRRAIWEDET
ncbi:hypothetical protein ABE073_04015 [Lederbergia citrisecunda]|uniref:hypothetical protein n=1 Tax=Lederbergia citrisecunda TaxID=2833583 RepID=UPI003D28DC65